MAIVCDLRDFQPPPSGCAVALGFFDGVHKGHQQILQRTVELTEGKEGLCPIAYTFANHPAEVLRPSRPMRLLTTEQERGKTIAAWGVNCVWESFTEELANLDPLVFLEEVLRKRLRARAVVSGSNYRFGRAGAGTPEMLAAWGAERGIEVCTVPLAVCAGERISSSRLRAAVGRGAMREVTDMLGHPYEVTNTVVHGRQLGRRLGFPTANLAWPEQKVTPALGAYACEVVLPDGEVQPGVGYFGSRPTVNSDETNVCLEVNIGHIREGRPCWDDESFAGDDEGRWHLYGREITVRFVEFLAPQTRFDGVEELKQRLLSYRRMTADLY